MVLLQQQSRIFIGTLMVFVRVCQLLSTRQHLSFAHVPLLHVFFCRSVDGGQTFGKVQQLWIGGPDFYVSARDEVSGKIYVFIQEGSSVLLTTSQDGECPSMMSREVGANGCDQESSRR